MRAFLVAIAVLVLAVPAAAQTTPPFQHAIVIVLENKNRSDLTPRSAPAFTSLARRYARIAAYSSAGSPSLPNYLALVSGSTHDVHSDCTTCAMTGETLGDQLDRAGRTWGAYAEGYPSSPRFAKKHVPFLYFARDVSHVHPLTSFDRAQLPDFAFVVPDLCHDMHDCSIATGDAWLRRFVTPLLTLPGTAIFVVFDEGRGSSAVAAEVLGTAVRPGSVFAAPTGHYGLLRTLEDAWSLPPLGRAATATPITGIWKSK
ncbi:MAG: alkaline phosphatase family protein [Gaiellaceae bacterium]